MNDKPQKSPSFSPDEMETSTGQSTVTPLETGDCKAEAGASKPVLQALDGLPAAKAQSIPPGLYPVATPIGNLRDITLRALDVLNKADVIACEDSRITRRLMAAYGVERPLLVYHEHNAAAVRPKILERLDQGQVVALVTDAGTPLVSDPGFKLVREVAAAGHKVYPIPGASAPIAALAGAGLPSDRFLFAGFSPSKKNARRAFLEEFNHIPATLIFFESPKRLKDCLAEMADLWPGREAAVARELTKLYEEFRRGTLTELAAHYQEQGNPKGEIVIILGPPDPEADQLGEADLDAILTEALENMSLRDATAHAVTLTGLKKKQVYSRALELNKLRDGG